MLRCDTSQYPFCDEERGEGEREVQLEEKKERERERESMRACERKSQGDKECVSVRAYVCMRAYVSVRACVCM